MKSIGLSVEEKPHSDEIVPVRIHYQAFTRWLVTGVPARESKRIRINSRGGRALLIDMGQ